jgi:hypothetical protein
MIGRGIGKEPGRRVGFPKKLRKDIESSLHISIHTVKSHVYSLYCKMNVKSRRQLYHRIGVYGGADGTPGKAR